jgi:GTP-binding protein
MSVSSASYLISVVDYRKGPAPDKPEYAFIGRSNVGKSSLINMVTTQGNLAKTSQKPGKTRTINYFLIDQAWYLVDLPGYGWAKISRTEREKWEPMIKEYLAERENLLCVFVLIDSRHPPQANDLAFMQWLAESGVPFAMVFTKADKLTPAHTQKNVEAYLQRMLEQWEVLPQYFVTSSETARGREELLDFIYSVNQKFRQ